MRPSLVQDRYCYQFIYMHLNTQYSLIQFVSCNMQSMPMLFFFFRILNHFIYLQNHLLGFGDDSQGSTYRTSQLVVRCCTLDRGCQII